MEAPTGLKIGFRGEIRRVQVDLVVFGFVDLQKLFETAFHLRHGSIAIQYKDVAVGFMPVRSSAEFGAACRVLLSQHKSLRFFCVPTVEAAFHDGVAESVRTGAVANKSRHGADTFETAVDEMSQANAAHYIVHADDTCMEEPNALDMAHGHTTAAVEQPPQPWPSLNMEQTSNNTAKNLRVAAAEVSAYTQGLVENFQLMHVAASPPAAASIRPPSPATTTAVGPSKWAAQLALVREIIPDADTTIVLALLETSKGDMQVVMDALTSN